MFAMRLTDMTHNHFRRLSWLALAVLALLLPAWPQLAVAQTTPAVPSQMTPASQSTLNVSAYFTGDPRQIRSGIVWRVLSDKGDGAAPQIVARATTPTASFSLEPGTYMIHAAYGFASGTRRITVATGASVTERIIVNAGGLRIAGSIGDNPIPAAKLTYSVFVPLQGNSEGRLVVANARSGDLLRLPEGTYHVVSTYGDSNAIQRADIKVEPGKVTEATMHHRAAKVTLKLVANAGGEAFAGTAFSVLTPGGDVIREAIGAFPQVILSEGNYVLIARQDGQLYTREFKVESGLDRDIEVLAQVASKVVPPATPAARP
jgi:hypothetical protein